MLRGRGAGVSIVAAVAAIGLLLIFAIRKPGNPALYPPGAGAETVDVYLIDNGFHTNLAASTARLASKGVLAAAIAADGAPAPYTEIGWGDARFYVETGVSPYRAMDGLRALLAPANASAVMVAPLRDRPDRLWRSGVVRITLSGAGFDAMAASIEHSLAQRNGRPVPLAGAPGFYRSVETFSLAHLCNHWTAERLNAAGLPVRPVLDSLPAGLIFDLETDGVTVHRAP